MLKGQYYFSVDRIFFEIPESFSNAVLVQ